MRIVKKLVKRIGDGLIYKDFGLCYFIVNWVGEPLRLRRKVCQLRLAWGQAKHTSFDLKKRDTGSERGFSQDPNSCPNVLIIPHTGEKEPAR